MRDSRYDYERQQTMKVLYKYLDQPEGIDLLYIIGAETLPLSILRAIVALSEQLDDRMRNSSIEMICELGIACYNEKPSEILLQYHMPAD